MRSYCKLLMQVWVCKQAGVIIHQIISGYYIIQAFLGFSYGSRSSPCRYSSNLSRPLSEIILCKRPYSGHCHVSYLVYKCHRYSPILNLGSSLCQYGSCLRTKYSFVYWRMRLTVMWRRLVRVFLKV